MQGVIPAKAGIQYHPGGYQAAFGVLLALQVAALVWLLVDEARMRMLRATSRAL